MITTEWVDFNKIHPDSLSDFSPDPGFSQKKPIRVRVMQVGCGGFIDTLEGKMRFEKGDYIIIGIENEVYAVKKEIFEKTYEKLSASERVN